MESRGPLSGYKILDFSQFESGTVCTETLAWMGAEVWKIEKLGKGETGRYSYTEPGIDTYGFIILNMNKNSVTCNLKSEEGRRMMLEAGKKADVIVENFGPGVMDRLGLGYEDFKAVNDKIIYASIKGFAEGSPYESYPSFSPIAQAMGGIPACSGFAGGPPLQPGVNMADSDAGYMCAMSIIAALLQRERQGVGQKCLISMHDVMVGLGRSNWESYYIKGKSPARVGNGMPMEDVAPADMFPCKPFGTNDYVHIYCSRHVGSDQFAKLCHVIGHDELLQDERFATPQSRFVYKDILNPYIEAWTRQHDKREAMAILSSAGVPAGAVMDCEDITHDASLRESGTMIEVEHSQRGKLVIPGFVPKMSENHIEYKMAPGLGDHNRAFYIRELGISEEEYENLMAKKII